jgi:hypothetical protein
MIYIRRIIVLRETREVLGLINGGMEKPSMPGALRVTRRKAEASMDGACF